MARPLAGLTRSVVATLVYAALSHGTAAADLERPPSKVSVGVFVGYPQTVGPTLEIRSHRDFRFQVSAGTVFFVSSVSGRLLIGDTADGFKPYGFAGGGLIDINEISSSGDPLGTTGFFWYGGGVRFQVRRVSLHLEIGSLAGMDVSKNYESTSPAAAVGLLIGL